MEVDAAEIKKKKPFQKATAEQEAIEVTKDNYNNREKLPVQTKKLRAFLQEHHGCFYCRELDAGHTAAKCPKRKTKKANANF